MENIDIGLCVGAILIFLFAYFGATLAHIMIEKIERFFKMILNRLKNKSKQNSDEKTEKDFLL